MLAEFPGHRRLAAMLDAVEDVVILVSRAGHNVYFNRAAASEMRAVTGLGPEELIGKDVRELGLPSALTERMDAERARVLAGESVTGEMRFPTADGGRWREHKLSPVYCGGDTVEAIAVVSRDIHERKVAEERLGEVLAILGHDLRNPLTAVRGLAALSLVEEGVPESVQGHLAHIDEAARRMVEMIETLLDFSEYRSRGSLPIAPIAADLHDVGRRVVEELRAANPGRVIELAVAGDARGEWDPARLAQVVSNLVGNAIIHGAKDAPVRIAVRGDDTGVVLEVHNRGPVIAPELLKVVFEPFRRGPVPGEAPGARGLGLGLHIARQIVRAHGGTISAASTAADGTRFAVRLPRRSVVH